MSKRKLEEVEAELHECEKKRAKLAEEKRAHPDRLPREIAAFVKWALGVDSAEMREALLPLKRIFEGEAAEKEPWSLCYEWEGKESKTDFNWRIGLGETEDWSKCESGSITLDEGVAEWLSFYSIMAAKKISMEFEEREQNDFKLTTHCVIPLPEKMKKLRSIAATHPEHLPLVLKVIGTLENEDADNDSPFGGFHPF